MAGGFRKNLIVKDKLGYVLGEKPLVECILCSIRDRDKSVKSLEVYRGKYFIVTLNLYPYNPGHMMIFPKRHLTDVRELKKVEWQELIEFQNIAIEIIEDEYGADSFNVGVNLGPNSGASIPHLHYHVVPRYRNEIGVVEIIAGAKILVELPDSQVKKMRKRFKLKLKR